MIHKMEKSNLIVLNFFSYSIEDFHIPKPLEGFIEWFRIYINYSAILYLYNLIAIILLYDVRSNSAKVLDLY